jgi:y4mF family transcriptional regulator
MIQYRSVMKNLKLVSDIGKRVREIRKGQGISQDMLAGLAGTGARYISELERGKETARIRELLKLLDALGAGLYVLTPREVAEWKRSTSI